MEWVDRLNCTINYIEENLADEINLDEIAKIACCSVYHYQRMFAYMTDTTLSEYIRRRRMSRAVADLLEDGSKVIDVALKYGYDSPTAFNRAFRGIHGIAPSEVKKYEGSLKAYPPLSFKISVKGEYEMDYRIEKKEAFRIVGVSTPISHEMEENIKELPKFWQKAGTDGTIGKLCTLMDDSSFGILGVSTCAVDADWKYYISIASNKPLEHGFEEFEVPDATWAVFPGKGTQIQITDLERRIVTEWLPTSGYEYANAPDIEVYIEPNPAEGRYEVWIPVEKKGE